jgi:hypothetical protein
MATRELLFDLFRKRLEALADEKGLSNPEKEAIIKTLRHAMANPYMTEDQIYQELIRKTTG